MEDLLNPIYIKLTEKVADPLTAEFERFTHPIISTRKSFAGICPWCGARAEMKITRETPGFGVGPRGGFGFGWDGICKRGHRIALTAEQTLRSEEIENRELNRPEPVHISDIKKAKRR